MQHRMSLDEVRAIVARISLGEVLYDRPTFRVMEKGDGYLLQLVYFEPDVTSEGSEPVQQFARKWYVSPFSTETEVVRTAHKAVLCSLEHRLGEHFRYNGVQVYSPHVPVGTLETAVRGRALDKRE